MGKISNINSLRALLRGALASAIAAFTVIPSSASAEIVARSEAGFAIIHIGDVAAQPDEIWRNVLLPNKWWSKDHSFSGDSKNFYLEPKISGCFCELLPAASDAQKNVGEVEHMRIIHIDRNRTLRMRGALGPLQSEAVNGTLTIAIKSNGDGTSKLSFSYVVGGYMRYDITKISPLIDAVIGEQFANLVKLLGPALSAKRDDAGRANATGEGGDTDDPLSLNGLLGDDAVSSAQNPDDENSSDENTDSPDTIISSDAAADAAADAALRAGIKKLQEAEEKPGSVRER